MGGVGGEKGDNSLLQSSPVLYVFEKEIFLAAVWPFMILRKIRFKFLVAVWIAPNGLLIGNPSWSKATMASREKLGLHGKHL